MRPIIEPEIDSHDDAGDQSQAATRPAVRKNRIGNLLILAGLICVGCIGFASSAGWLDFSSWLDSSKPESAADPEAMVGQPAGDGQSSVASTAPSSPASSPSLPPLNPIIPLESAAFIEEAKRVAEHLVQLMPASLEAKEMQARYEYEFGRITVAQKIWTEILEVEPNYAFALRGLGDVATIDGDLSGAVRYYRRSVLSEPNDLSRQVTLGVALLQAAQLAEAKQVLEAVLARDAGNITAIVELANVLLQTQDYEGARDRFQAVVQAVPEHPLAHLGLANAYSRLRDREKAQLHQAEHVRLQKQVTETRQQGRRDYDDVQAHQVDIGKLYVDMSRVYLAGGHRAAAERLLLRASRMNLEDIDCRQALAFLAVNQGKTFDGIRWLKEVAVLRPNELTFAREIARLHLDVGQVADAERALLEFLHSHPDNLESLRAVARFYVEVSPNPDKAIQYGEAGKDLAPTAESYAMLASIYESADKNEQAIQALQQAVALDPNNATYQQVLALMRDSVSLQSQAPAKP